MFSPPGWMILVNILSYKKNKKNASRLASFKSSNQTDVRAWASTQT
jgi:hypothetical protein